MEWTASSDCARVLLFSRRQRLQRLLARRVVALRPRLCGLGVKSRPDAAFFLRLLALRHFSIAQPVRALVMRMWWWGLSAWKRARPLLTPRRVRLPSAVSPPPLGLDTHHHHRQCNMTRRTGPPAACANGAAPPGAAGPPARAGGGGWYHRQGPAELLPGRPPLGAYVRCVLARSATGPLLLLAHLVGSMVRPRHEHTLSSRGMIGWMDRSDRMADPFTNDPRWSTTRTAGAWTRASPARC